MENLWFLLPLLACPLVMGGMMLWMIRGGRRVEKRPSDKEEASE